jgi:hypothetical protein
MARPDASFRDAADVTMLIMLETICTLLHMPVCSSLELRLVVLTRPRAKCWLFSLMYYQVSNE